MKDKGILDILKDAYVDMVRGEVDSASKNVMLVINELNLRMEESEDE